MWSEGVELNYCKGNRTDWWTFVFCILDLETSKDGSQGAQDNYLVPVKEFYHSVIAMTFFTTCMTLHTFLHENCVLQYPYL